MSDAAPRLASFEDLMRLPEDVRAEVLDGTVITSPARLPKYSKAQRALGRFVGGPFDDDHGYGGPGGWWIFVEVDIQLGPHDIVRPDIAGWRRERLQDPGDQRPILVAPDWVCEVLSPSTAAHDKITKRSSGIAHYWIVDVDGHTLEAFELVDQRWVLVGTYGDAPRPASRHLSR
jgi:Uma2 family endonuclease